MGHFLEYWSLRWNVLSILYRSCFYSYDFSRIDAYNTYYGHLLLQNAQLNCQHYYVLRKEKTIHHHLQHFVQNNFRYSNALSVYCRIVLQRFFRNILRRRFMRRKLQLLIQLSYYMEDRLLFEKILHCYV